LLVFILSFGFVVVRVIVHMIKMIVSMQFFIDFKELKAMDTELKLYQMTMTQQSINFSLFRLSM